MEHGLRGATIWRFDSVRYKLKAREFSPLEDPTDSVRSRPLQDPRRPYLPVGWLWYLGTLVPVIGLIQVGYQAMLGANVCSRICFLRHPATVFSMP